MFSDLRPLHLPLDPIWLPTTLALVEVVVLAREQEEGTSAAALVIVSQ